LIEINFWFFYLLGVFGQEESTATADNETTESEEATDSPSVPPHISTEPQTFLVQSGQRVVLPCKITNLQEAGAVVVWKRGEKWLTNGVVTFKGNPSISLDKETYTLTIKRAHDRDAGNYSCIASAGSDNEVKVQHLVIIVCK
jgi:Immunoglobulin domain